MIDKTILLIRHAHALKNHIDIQGGHGTSLSTEGVKQGDSLYNYFHKNYSSDNAIIIGYNNTQVIETMEYISKAFKINYELDANIRGTDLGLISGLSKKEAEALSPNDFLQLEQWSKGMLPTYKLNLTNAEPFEIFYNRVKKSVVKWLISDKKLVIVVSTRSSLIMLLNIFTLWDNFNIANYKPYIIENAFINIVNVNNNKINVVALNNDIRQK